VQFHIIFLATLWAVSPAGMVERHPNINHLQRIYDSKVRRPCHSYDYGRNAMNVILPAGVVKMAIPGARNYNF
jgi:hypothetical protein